MNKMWTKLLAGALAATVIIPAISYAAEDSNEEMGKQEHFKNCIHQQMDEETMEKLKEIHQQVEDGTLTREEAHEAMSGLGIKRPAR